MIKFQIGKLTLKNFIIHYIVSIMFSLIIFNFIFFETELTLINIVKLVFIFLALGIFPGMLGSIMIIASVKELIGVVKEKNYFALIAMIIFTFVLIKYFF